jgi:Rieske Fe-S protein
MSEQGMSERDVSRRNLLQGAGIAIGAGVLGAVGYTVYGPGGHGAQYQPPAGVNGSGSVLAPVAEIPDGGGVVLSTAKIVLTRAGNKIAAFSAVCTHQACLVNSVQDRLITCPCHGSTFDAATGQVRNGPATQPLPPVQIHIVNDSVVAG